MPDVTYPPLDTLKPTADGLWIVDSGPHRVGGLPLPVRMTVMRLEDGSLLLHSPTRPAPGLVAEVERKGPVGHLAAPSIGHWAYIAGWQARYPRAITWAIRELRRRPFAARNIRFDREIGEPAPDEWEATINTVVIRAPFFGEAALFHRPSRTLVLTDLIVNLERAKLPPPVRFGATLAGSVAPRGRAPVYVRAALRMNRRSATRAAQRLVALEPERVVFAHGAWFEEDAAAKLRRALSWLL